MRNSDGKQCNCGHFKGEHEWIRHTSVWEAPGIGLKESYGQCKKCLCPKYYSPNIFYSEHIKYPVRTTDNNDLEKRCTRCGRLLSSHVDVGHPFQDTKTAQD